MTTILDFIPGFAARQSAAKPVPEARHAYDYSHHMEIVAEARRPYDYQPKHRADVEAQ